MLGLITEQFLTSPKALTQRLDGRVAIVTGSNQGLGYTAAVHLAKVNPARLILAVRNLERGNAAKDKLLNEQGVDLPADRVQVWQLDLDSFASVKSFADRCNKELDRLDLLLENAGVYTLKFLLSSDGHEITLDVPYSLMSEVAFTVLTCPDAHYFPRTQTNALATGLLGVLLLPLIIKTSSMPAPDPASASYKPHLTVVGSEVHAWAKYDELNHPSGSILTAMDDEAQFKKVGGSDRYNVSKVMSITIAHKLAELAKEHDVVVNVVNPGLCVSDFRHDLPWVAQKFLNAIARSTMAGGQFVAWAALEDTSAEPGAYVTACQVKPPSAFVRSQRGREAEDQVWREFTALWEKVAPEVKSVLSR